MESKKKSKHTFFLLENFCLNFSTEFDAVWSLASLISDSDANLAAM